MRQGEVEGSAPEEGVSSMEETDNLQKNKKKVKTGIGSSGEGRDRPDRDQTNEVRQEERSKERRKALFKEAVMGGGVDE